MDSDPDKWCSVNRAMENCLGSDLSPCRTHSTIPFLPGRISACMLQGSTLQHAGRNSSGAIGQVHRFMYIFLAQANVCSIAGVYFWAIVPTMKTEKCRHIATSSRKMGVLHNMVAWSVT